MDELGPWVGAAVLVAVLQISGSFVTWLAPLALIAAKLTGALSLLVVFLTLLGGTIGGGFHIDPPVQVLLWYLVALIIASTLVVGSRRDTRSGSPRVSR